MAKVAAAPKFSEMKWRVVGPLGTGAGSTIFQISDKTAGGKRYALKVVKRDDENDNPNVYIDQARTEFEAAQKLNHPTIAKVYDLRVKRSWFKVSGVELLLEFVDGKTLDEIEAPEMGQLILMFCQVASALSHMHRRGVFHGDLKPSNIMLSKNGQVKLIDFGTAWIRNREKNRAGGTPQYVAPEQAIEKTIDAKTDVYNLGATMYRMFTGRFANQGLPKAGEGSGKKLVPPEKTTNWLSLPAKAGEGSGKKLVPPTKINPKLPAALNELIISCLEYGPDRRPASMFDVQQKLTEVAKSIGLDTADLKGTDDEED